MEQSIDQLDMRLTELVSHFPIQSDSKSANKAQHPNE